MLHAFAGSAASAHEAADVRLGDIAAADEPTWSWDDVRYFVAAARSGSTLAASKALNVSQTTVARRIDQLEQRIGRRLFERRQGGYRLTSAGQDVLTDAQRMRDGVLDFLSLFPAGQPPLAGRLRIVTEPALAANVVLPALERVRLDAPAVSWSVLINERPADLLAGDADVRLGEGRSGRGVGLQHRRIRFASAGRANRGEALWLSYTTRQVSDRLATFVADAVEAELVALGSL